MQNFKKIDHIKLHDLMAEWDFALFELYDEFQMEMTTILTPTFPDSMTHKLCGLPFSTRATLSFLNDRRSTYTMDGSGLEAPWE